MGEYDRHLPEDKILGMINDPMEAMGYELVQIKLLGRENPTVQIMIERKDGTPITVADCSKLSREIGAILDVEDPIAGKWMLEISSPGIDRPLIRVKDWEKYVGHMAKAELEVPMDQRKRFTGTILKVVDGKSIVLRLMEGEEVELELSNIRKAKLLLTDMLLKGTPAAHS